MLKTWRSCGFGWGERSWTLKSDGCIGVDNYSLKEILGFYIYFADHGPFHEPETETYAQRFWSLNAWCLAQSSVPRNVLWPSSRKFFFFFLENKSKVMLSICSSAWHFLAPCHLRLMVTQVVSWSPIYLGNDLAPWNSTPGVRSRVWFAGTTFISNIGGTGCHIWIACSVTKLLHGSNSRPGIVFAFLSSNTTLNWSDRRYSLADPVVSIAWYITLLVANKLVNPRLQSCLWPGTTRLHNSETDLCSSCISFNLD
jgi:hypothetical protein